MRNPRFDVPEEGIETNAARTTAVRVKRPAKVSPAEFVASMMVWLDHQCILLADLKAVGVANAEGLYVAEFDNPRDANLFARRFAGQPVLPDTSPRTSRNNPSRLLQFRGKLKAQKEVHPLDQNASAIVGARVT
jgi:hypothetical protein